MSTATRLDTMPASARRPETLTPNWQDRSACYNRPEEWWDGDNAQLTGKARAVCLSCPVLAECLAEKMRQESRQTWSRSSVRAALTGPERTQLHVDEHVDGEYDAEEARLLALEAGAYGKPVAEIAEADVSVSTVRLAARMAGESVSPRSTDQVVKDSKVQEAFQHADQIMAWRDEGVSRRQICERLGVSQSAVNTVISSCLSLVGESSGGKRTVQNIEDVDQVDVNDYLNGQPVQLTDDQRLAAVVEGLRRGMRYPDIDRVQSLARATTAQFVSRLRKRYAKDGREFPITSMTAKRLTFTDEQVLAIREEYAAGGVRDMDLAMRYGVSRNVISHVVSGRNYKHVGGPIRKGRSDAAKAASKAMNDSVCAVAFGRTSDRNKMGEAA